MDLMLDLETLGTGCDAAFGATGWAAFNRSTLGIIEAEGAIQVDPQSCIDLGMSVDWSTVKWWLGQPDAARDEMGKPGKPLADALQELAVVCDKHVIECVWSRGQDFDLAILRTAYRLVGQPLPWKFWNGRDLRTWLDACGVDHRQIPRPDGNIAHFAGDDAAYQALCAQHGYAALRR